MFLVFYILLQRHIQYSEGQICVFTSTELLVSIGLLVNGWGKMQSFAIIKLKMLKAQEYLFFCHSGYISYFLTKINTHWWCRIYPCNITWEKIINKGQATPSTETDKYFTWVEMAQLNLKDKRFWNTSVRREYFWPIWFWWLSCHCGLEEHKKSCWDGRSYDIFGLIIALSCTLLIFIWFSLLVKLHFMDFWILQPLIFLTSNFFPRPTLPRHS